MEKVIFLKSANGWRISATIKGEKVETIIKDRLDNERAFVLLSAIYETEHEFDE